MRSNRQNRAETTLRLGRWAGALTTMGALAAVLVMALTPVASAVTTAAIHNATPIINDDLNLSGCAKGKVDKPTLSVLTGVGSAYMSGNAHNCPLSLGGKNVESYADMQSGLGAVQSLKLSSAATQVNMTWNMKALISTSATGTLTHCPTTHYSFTGLFINSTGGTSNGYINETEQYCEVESFFELYAEPEVYDVTTGTYTYGFSFIAQNTSGAYYENYTETVNYTNPAWASMNSTYSCLNCSGSFGASSSYSLSSTYSTLISGSWAKGDHLIIYAELYVFSEAYIEYASHAHAAALFNAKTSGNHLDLTAITVS
jgi:hypothetical protein